MVVLVVAGNAADDRRGAAGRSVGPPGEQVDRARPHVGRASIGQPAAGCSWTCRPGWPNYPERGCTARSSSCCRSRSSLFSATLTDSFRYARPAAGRRRDPRGEAARSPGLQSTARRPGHSARRRRDRPVERAAPAHRHRRHLAAAHPDVLLDEATSGLDTHAEKPVLRAPSRLVTGRTIVTTTHDPASPPGSPASSNVGRASFSTRSSAQA